MKDSFLRIVVAGVALWMAGSGAYAGGWDYNLRTECASSPWPNQAGYYYWESTPNDGTRLFAGAISFGTTRTTSSR